jgi:hypothetical protein
MRERESGRRARESGRRESHQFLSGPRPVHGAPCGTATRHAATSLVALLTTRTHTHPRHIRARSSQHSSTASAALQMSHAGGGGAGASALPPPPRPPSAAALAWRADTRSWSAPKDSGPCALWGFGGGGVCEEGRDKGDGAQALSHTANTTKAASCGVKPAGDAMTTPHIGRSMAWAIPCRRDRRCRRRGRLPTRNTHTHTLAEFAARTSSRTARTGPGPP